MKLQRQLTKLFSRFTLVGLTIILIFLCSVALIVGAVYFALLIFNHYQPDYTRYVYYGLSFFA